MKQLVFLTTFWGLLAAGMPPASAQPETLRVVETVWGFDGRVVPGQFNPVTILLDNLSDEPLDGRVELQLMAGMLRPSGGVYTQPVYLAANTRRWVQLYPYIEHATGTWTMRLRTAERSYALGTPTQGQSAFGQPSRDKSPAPPVAVILDPPGMARQSPTTVKHMSDEIFPPYATATLGLQVLFLDHVPDWETPRQETLLSWLRCGGDLHLLRNVNGEELSFPAALAPLNEPFPEFAVGAGTVTRHDIQRIGLTSEIVSDVLGRRPMNVDLSELEDELARRQQGGLANWQSMANAPSQADDELLTGMRRLTQPEHAWWLILLLSLCYILLIFPGCWLLSQKRTLHYLTTYGAITALALVFSLLFLFIGRRGYGESTVGHTIAVARFEDDTHCNLLQWSSLFVTSGDDYQVSAPEQQSLFSIGSDEATDARITAGNQAVMRLGIPPFSSQTFLARRRAAVPAWELRLRDIETNANSLVRLRAEVGPAFPDHEDCQYLVLYRDSLYSLSLETGSQRVLRMQNSRGSLNTFCLTDRNARQTFRGFGFWRQPVEDNDSRDAAQRFFDESINVLVHRSLLDDGVIDPLRFSLPPDRVRLFIYAPIPEQLQFSVSTPAAQRGRLLYVRDVPVSTADASEASD